MLGIEEAGGSHTFSELALGQFYGKTINIVNQ